MSLPYRDALEGISPYVPGKPIVMFKGNLGLSKLLSLHQMKIPSAVPEMLRKC